VALIWFLRVLARHWKSTAGIQKSSDAEDREIPLGGDPEATESYKRGYLAYVWEAVGRAALEQVWEQLRRRRETVQRARWKKMRG